MASKSAFRRLLRFVGPHWPRYALALLGVVVTSVLEVGKAGCFKYILDGMSQGSWRLIYTALWLGGGILVVETITNFTKAYMVDTASAKVVLDIREAVFAKVRYLPLRYFERTHSGDIMSRFTNDMGSVGNAVGWQLVSLVENPLSALVAFVYLATLDFWLALFCLLVGPTTVLAGRLFGGSLRHNAVRIQEKSSVILTLLSDTVASMPIIKSFGMEDTLGTRFRKELLDLYALNRGNSLISSSLNGTANALGYVSILTTFGLASYKVMHGQMTIGTVLAFTQLMNRLTWPFSGLAGLLGSLQAAMASADRVFSVLDEPDEFIDGSVASPVGVGVGGPASIELHGVCFSYDEANPVLTDLSLRVSKGETLALVGPSGSGKSSLIKLLLGFHQPTRGSILIDGIDTHELGLCRLRRLSSFVPQETILVSGTIEDNIRWGNPGASAVDVIHAAMAANAHGFITELHDGYGTLVGERGTRLSGGQRQRIAIARALLRDPGILLLDEATSALDNESESLVQEALTGLMRGRTCVVVAHRLSTIRNADRIAVLEAGRLAELGTHQELLDLKGLYASMYYKQFVDVDVVA